VLQHVAPTEIKAAVDELKSLARRLVILREATFLRDESHYQWAHDYCRLLSDWTLEQREITDETESFRTELLVFAPTRHGKPTKAEPGGTKAESGGGPPDGTR
jgi:hypothetical protein